MPDKRTEADRPDDLQTLLSFLKFSQQDEEHLKALSEVFAPHIPDIVHSFYQHLQEFEETASLLTDELITKVQQVASSTATILITGESGTGKEVFANAIHALSPRINKPMIKVNCGAFPDTLLESELFGYEKGAFTDAKASKPGRFELADEGTLFLDEIGEMPKSLQVKLLRVLQDGKFERLGGTKPLCVDVRLIAATNKDLTMEVEAGNFRNDLFYRLNVITLELPPLRSRREDIPLLVDCFLKKYAEKAEKPIRGISRQALEALEAYHWPGNIRELENAIEQAAVLTQSQYHRAAGSPGIHSQG